MRITGDEKDVESESRVVHMDPLLVLGMRMALVYLHWYRIIHFVAAAPYTAVGTHRIIAIAPYTVALYIEVSNSSHSLVINQCLFQ